MTEQNRQTVTQDLEAALKALEKRVGALEARVDKDRLCIGVMKGDLDYTMAAFIIALGAAAYDMEVDMFFTFWATAALRDPKKSVKKGFLDRMFGSMLPKGSRKLPLSKMQMMGIGPKMIRAVMKSRNAKSLEELMEEAAKMGIRIHVCTMSMEVMGIRKEELIDYPHMDFVGVGTFVDMFSEARQCFFM
ncbi:MAG TPA: DsrE/DsrF/DrsH-like family protein [Candidatus Hydrogenedentes bacterium]|mgnify:FL=1|nr:DsrE/DsrF/DrsH-like family protein [Candidatus Hydrogenedentota bacterium]